MFFPRQILKHIDVSAKTSAFCRLPRQISNPAFVTVKISQRESFTIRKSKSIRNMLELAFDNLYYHKFIRTIDLPYSVSSICTTCWRSFRDIACFILTDILVRSLRVTIGQDSAESFCCNNFLFTFIDKRSSAFLFNSPGSLLCFGRCLYNC